MFQTAAKIFLYSLVLLWKVSNEIFKLFSKKDVSNVTQYSIARQFCAAADVDLNLAADAVDVNYIGWQRFST